MGFPFGIKSAYAVGSFRIGESGPGFDEGLAPVIGYAPFNYRSYRAVIVPSTQRIRKDSPGLPQI